MPSVTQRIAQVKQPCGGYVNPTKMLANISLGVQPPFDSKAENVSPGLVGIAVDYLTRVMTGTQVKQAFKISFFGAGLMDQRDNAEALASRIKGLDDDSIVVACKLVGYDSAFRAGPMAFRPIEDINPNEETVENVRAMVESGLKFFEEYGPVTHDGITPTTPSGSTTRTTSRRGSAATSSSTASAGSRSPRRAGASGGATWATTSTS